jgi:hypothetical protein
MIRVECDRCADYRDECAGLRQRLAAAESERDEARRIAAFAVGGLRACVKMPDRAVPLAAQALEFDDAKVAAGWLEQIVDDARAKQREAEAVLADLHEWATGHGDLVVPLANAEILPLAVRVVGVVSQPELARRTEKWRRRG